MDALIFCKKEMEHLGEWWNLLQFEIIVSAKTDGRELHARYLFIRNRRDDAFAAPMVDIPYDKV
ncbi:hypothetical protein LQZ18_03435 [Lachnospiraceae bacterium ZAX-1]